MRSVWILAGFLCCLQQTMDQRGQATFSVSVDLIKIPVAILDESGSVVHELHPRDFRLYEDGVRQDIRSIGLDRNPVSTILLVDTSATVEKELKKIKEAAEEFAKTLSPEDRVCVITFGDEASLALDWTSDHKRVGKVLRKVRPGGRTALYDGMFMAATDQLREIEGRKAIILLTDGLNNQSSVTFGQAALAITQSQATLYVVSKTAMVRQAARTQRRVVMLESIYRRMFGEENYIEKFFEKIEAEMTSLAEGTGGRCYFPRDYNQIPDAYRDVARDLKSGHYLTYVSNQRKERNTYHRIELQYLRPAQKVSYRRGYYHEPEPIRFPERLP